jgi:hypothetical protein
MVTLYQLSSHIYLQQYHKKSTNHHKGIEFMKYMHGRIHQMPMEDVNISFLSYVDVRY